MAGYSKGQLPVHNRHYCTGSTDKEIRIKGAPGATRTVKKPTVASSYNKSMGGVDRFDQLLSYHPYPHKVQKWYHVLFHYMKEAALVNSFILYNATNPNARPKLDSHALSYLWVVRIHLAVHLLMEETAIQKRRYILRFNLVRTVYIPSNPSHIKLTVVPILLQCPDNPMHNRYYKILK